MNESLLSDKTEKSYWDILTGPGGKFHKENLSADDAKEIISKGKIEADNMIEVMKRQQDQLRQDFLKLQDDYNARAKLEEIVDKIDSSRHSTSGTETSANTGNRDKPIDIDSLVSSKIHEHELTKKQQENFNIVKGKLQERFGPNYQTTLKEHIAALELTEDYVNDLARRSPTALLKTLGLDGEVTKDPFQAPPRSSQRSDTFKPVTNKRTWTHYQDLYKKEPKLYYDPKTTNQMMKDYEELGSAFEDGDFHRQF